MTQLPVFKNLTIFDCEIGMTSPPGPNILQDSVIIGETDNVGTAFRPSVDLGGRSRPGLWSSTDVIKVCSMFIYISQHERAIKPMIMEAHNI